MMYPKIFSIFCLLLLGSSFAEQKEDYKTFIVQLDQLQKPSRFSTSQLWHKSILNSLSTNSSQTPNEEALLYSYQNAIHGFCARLTNSQLLELQKSPAHISSHEDTFGKMLTTYSPKFLGLKHQRGIWPAASYGDGVIVGVIDSGIWPESESFRDKGMPPVPQSWKGKCDQGEDFDPSASCNRKLVGARAFWKGFVAAGGEFTPTDYRSARDSDGHGTHIASTVAGAHVQGATYFGYAKGTARGMAPAARIAAYKVGWNEGIAASDALAAMDQAISDGVEVISLSFGFQQAPYFTDVIAVASLSAIEKGIVVVSAAGNEGTYNGTYNGAPWMLNVGAGTVDRGFGGTLLLGNGVFVEGISYFPLNALIENRTLYYGGVNHSTAACSFPSSQVSGKIVLCIGDVHADIDTIAASGASAGILLADPLSLEPYLFTFPVIVLQNDSWNLVKSYATSEKEATITSLRFTVTRFGRLPAPKVADFSSRGPDPVNPGVLKPDVIAPGVDILAAFPPTRRVVTVNGYNLSTEYNLDTGTSMAAPHVAGIAALLKAVYKDWSPAAIRSAIMTTAEVVDNRGMVINDLLTGLPGTPLDFGAGHINPNKALNPGLIYDLGFQDYADFLCGIGYTKKQMSAVLRRSNWSCRQNSDINYPSFVAMFSRGIPSAAKNFSRMVTTVGEEDTSTYRAEVVSPTGMKIKIEPTVLSFTSKHQKNRYFVSVEVSHDAPSLLYGYIKWTDQHGHLVSSPIVALVSA